MKNLTNNLHESILEKIEPLYILQVESSTDIQAWAPIVFEMRHDYLIDVFSSIQFNDDGTKIIWETTDLSQCGLNILITAQKFKELLGFFVERTKQGDIISVWVSVPEFNKLIDQMAETNETTQDAESEIEKLPPEEKTSNEIKFSSPEELAAEILSFSKKEFPDQDDERPIPVHVIIGNFWRSKSINQWNLPADIKFRICAIPKSFDITSKYRCEQTNESGYPENHSAMAERKTSRRNCSGFSDYSTTSIPAHHHI